MLRFCRGGAAGVKKKGGCKRGRKRMATNAASAAPQANTHTCSRPYPGLKLVGEALAHRVLGQIAEAVIAACPSSADPAASAGPSAAVGAPGAAPSAAVGTGTGTGASAGHALWQAARVLLADGDDRHETPFVMDVFVTYATDGAEASEVETARQLSTAAVKGMPCVVVGTVSETLAKVVTALNGHINKSAKNFVSSQGVPLAVSIATKDRLNNPDEIGALENALRQELKTKEMETKDVPVAGRHLLWVDSARAARPRACVLPLPNYDNYKTAYEAALCAAIEVDRKTDGVTTKRATVHREGEIAGGKSSAPRSALAFLCKKVLAQMGCSDHTAVVISGNAVTGTIDEKAPLVARTSDE